MTLNDLLYNQQVAQFVKIPPAEEVQSQGWEDPLEEGMAVNSSNILAWRIPWTEEPDGLQSTGHRESA